jgi:type VI protein secretion system component VasF
VASQIDRLSPQTTGQSNAQQMAMSQVERLLDARRQRLMQAAPSVPMVLWIALVAGALAMLLFAYLFGVENRPAQLVMTAVLAGLIALLFVVIAEFDSPFSGSVRISPDGWTYLGYHLPTIP